MDVASNQAATDAPTLILSSGLHGVEGFFGSAVQRAYLRTLIDRRIERPAVRVLCFHALNPFGFSHRRRFDQDNIDLNRNFLPAESPYESDHSAYRQLDPFLNPRHGPRFECFHWRALQMIWQHGYRALIQAIAGGQYAFPQGIFYGGSQPAETHRLLLQHWHRWLGDTPTVVHLDWHTGLGRWATHDLLFDYKLSTWHRTVCRAVHAPDRSKANASSSEGYTTRGSWGAWCQAAKPATLKNYFYACAEFGTYGPIEMLRGLRAENQAHHWGDPTARSTQRAKERLTELFCPASRSWRHQVVTDAIALIERSEHALTRSSL